MQKPDSDLFRSGGNRVEYNMELKVRQVMASYYRRKWAGVGICAAAILYLVYLEIFKMDYRISLVVGGFASLLLSLSVFLVYFGLAAVMVILMMSASTVISETLTKGCDPYLYEACLNRLTILFYKDRVACNYALAQYYQGNFEQARETLQRINIYKLKGRFRLNYYVLACALHFRYGTGERAAELEQTYRAMVRNKKEQKQFQMLCAGNNLFRAMENKDYEAAYRFIREREELNGPVSNFWQNVIFQMMEARICAAMGETRSAKLKLQYVVSHGGRLFYVDEARRMLSEMGVDGGKEAAGAEEAEVYVPAEEIEAGEPAEEAEVHGPAEKADAYKPAEDDMQDSAGIAVEKKHNMEDQTFSVDNE